MTLKELRREAILRKSASIGMILQCRGFSSKFLASTASTNVLQQEKKEIEFEPKALIAEAVRSNCRNLCPSTTSKYCLLIIHEPLCGNMLCVSMELLSLIDGVAY